MGSKDWSASRRPYLDWDQNISLSRGAQQDEDENRTKSKMGLRLRVFREEICERPMAIHASQGGGLHLGLLVSLPYEQYQVRGRRYRMTYIHSRPTLWAYSTKLPPSNPVFGQRFCRLLRPAK